MVMTKEGRFRKSGSNSNYDFTSPHLGRKQVKENYNRRSEEQNAGAGTCSYYCNENDLRVKEKSVSSGMKLDQEIQPEPSRAFIICVTGSAGKNKVRVFIIINVNHVIQQAPTVSSDSCKPLLYQDII